jgi:uncharacterized membrane protein YeiH
MLAHARHAGDAEASVLGTITAIGGAIVRHALIGESPLAQRTGLLCRFSSFQPIDHGGSERSRPSVPPVAIAAAVECVAVRLAALRSGFWLPRAHEFRLSRHS